MTEASTRKRRRRQPSPERIAATRKQHMLLLALLVVLVFASTLGGDFVWTDREDLLQGAFRIDSTDDVRAALTQSRDAFRARTLGGTADPGAGSWQPLVLLLNSVSWAIWGDCAFCFHLENILLHLAIVIGLYALGRHLLSHRRHGNRIAAWAAALYAVHPATVTAVAWVGGRPTLLAAAFSVWTLVIFTRLQATTNSRPGHVRRWLIALLLTSMGALLSHESAMMLPLIALLVAGFESSERGRHPLGGISPRRRKGLLVLVGGVLLFTLYRLLALGGMRFDAPYPADGTFANIGTGLRHLWFLIDEALLPGEPILSDAWRITQSWGAGETAAFLGLLLILAGIVIGFRMRHPAALGASWLLLWLVPGVGLFPSDHYHDNQTLYLAVWGVAFAISFGILQLWRPVGRQLVPGSEALAYVPLIIVLAVITAFSNARWWDHSGLFEAEVSSDPHYMEGRIELAKAALDQGTPEIALNHALAAIEASGDEGYTGYWSPAETYLLLGRAQWQMERYGEAAASFARAIERAPDDARVYHGLGLAELAQESYEAAEESLRVALKLRSPYPEAEADLGAALAGQKRYVEAFPLLAAAIDAGLGTAWRHRALAMVYIDGRRLEDAARHLEIALAEKDSAEVRARLAWLHWQLGDKARAEAELAAAQALDERGSEYVQWVRDQLAGKPESD
ncbi:MAG: tetratricopeptide repeat protein [Gammaproteobacteria bacterium]|nr:tetratricopeptide repeat protein [Gammaproteobacteria bacterium]